MHFRHVGCLIMLCQSLLLARAALADQLLLSADEALPGRIAGPATLLSAEWLHYFPSGFQASGGVSTYAAGEFHRTLALGTALLPLGSRFKLALEAKAGPASGGTDRYTQIEGVENLIFTATPSTFLAAGEHYMSVGPASGILAEVSVTQVIAHRFSMLAKLLTTASGNLNSNATYVQADYYGQLHWIAGGAVGKANPWLNDFFIDSAGHFNEAFGAVGIEAFGMPVTFYLKRYSSASVQQWGVAMLVKVPLLTGK